jgi:hypothetical protein
MTVAEARVWLVKSSFVATASLFVFFVLAPLFGYPLDGPQIWRVLQIVSPVFVGYLGAAAQYVFAQKTAHEPSAEIVASPLFALFIRWPIVVFAIMVTVLLIAFGLANRRVNPAPVHLGIEDLSTGLAVALGLLTVTTNVAVMRLFGQEGK